MKNNLIHRSPSFTITNIEIIVLGMSAAKVLDALKHLQKCFPAPKRKTKASVAVKASLAEISKAIEELVS